MATVDSNPRSGRRRYRRVPAPALTRAGVIALMLLTVGLAHWLTPIEGGATHLVHVVMRKLFLLPIILAAIWFRTPGALAAAGVTTLIYLPHILLQWSGFHQENMNQASDIVAMWAAAVLVGWLVQRERTVLQDLARSNEGAVRSLIAALDAREHQTEAHSLRVQAYARRIGQEMGLGQARLAALELGALLHDVGKIGVSDHILLKPGPLTEDEWGAMRRHPEIGKRILSTTQLPAESIEIVLRHHEHHDGSGYPSGLSGEEIPLLVRIFAVADAFDAMTSSRPYRRADSIDAACRAIEACRGAQFDPDVVDAFRRVQVEEWQRLSRHTEATADQRNEGIP